MLGRREGVALRLHIKRLHAYRPIPHLDPATRSPSIGPAATRPKAHYPGQNRGSPQTTMKHLLLTTIAAVLVVGCGPKPPTAKAPDISIHDAAREGNIEAVKQHLATGTDVNTKNNRGKTSLHRAAEKGHKEIAELLIAAGADVNAKDNNGETPLDLANKTETAELLRKHGGKTGEELKAEGK